MLLKTASGLVGLMLLGGASMVSIRAVSAASASCGPQIALYVTFPLSSRGSSSRPVYGLRIGEFRKRPTTTQLVAKAPIVRELMDVQIEGRSDVRVEVGRRLVWSITRGAFDSRSSAPVLAIAVPIKGVRLSDAANQEPWDLGTSGMSALADNPIQARQLDGERIADCQHCHPFTLDSDRQAARLRTTQADNQIQKYSDSRSGAPATQRRGTSAWVISLRPRA